MVSEAAAIDLMTQAFSVVPGRYKRADVIMVADYYDPIQVCELVRK